MDVYDQPAAFLQFSSAARPYITEHGSRESVQASKQNVGRPVPFIFLINECLAGGIFANTSDVKDGDRPIIFTGGKINEAIIDD